MSARVVAGVRARDAAVEEETGDHAVWLAVSHGDPIKAILADALGMHLDAFQRIAVDPGSLSVVRYTPHRAFVLTMNSGAGSLAHLASKPRKRRTRSSDAVVGGGAGPSAGTDPLGSVPCRSSTDSTRPSASCRARSASPAAGRSSSRRAPATRSPRWRWRSSRCRSWASGWPSCSTS